MDKRTVIIAGALLMAAILVAPVAVYAQPIPKGISGIVHMSDGVTEAPTGTGFSVNDTTSGFFIEGTTGTGPHSGWYSVSINGSDGDTVLIRAWNETHYGERTVSLAGDMTGIDVTIDTPYGPGPTPTPSPPQPHGIQGIVYMSDGVTEAPVGTGFSVNDTTSGFFIEGTTGAGSHSGWYSVSVDGNDGDTVIIRAWNETHYGGRTVTLEGEMRDIEVTIDTAFGPTPTPTPTSTPAPTPTPTSTPTPTPPPIPHGISGIVYMSDGVTEAPVGTDFSVNDITSGDFIQGTTGAPGHSGWYSVSINGNTGDTVRIRAWNETHYGKRTVTLTAGEMTGIDVTIDTPLEEKAELPALTPVGAIALVGLLSIAVAIGIRKKKI